jgi:hypothetical protein
MPGPKKEEMTLFSDERIARLSSSWKSRAAGAGFSGAVRAVPT